MIAFYDYKPSKLEASGDGSYRYRWDIQPIEAQEDSVRVQYQCQEVTVWAPITPNRITDAVISELWPSNYEQKLINEYNTANMGVYEGDMTEMKIAAYKNFLTERLELKTQIDIDCQELGIK